MVVNMDLGQRQIARTIVWEESHTVWTVLGKWLWPQKCRERLLPWSHSLEKGLSGSAETTRSLWVACKLVHTLSFVSFCFLRLRSRIPAGEWHFLQKDPFQQQESLIPEIHSLLPSPYCPYCELPIVLWEQWSWILVGIWQNLVELHEELLTTGTW
jgi:hypothetical protein